MSNPTIDFYLELASPYSYLAATQIEQLAGEHGASVAWTPIVLGAVFKATGNGMPARIPAKAQYLAKDLARWSATYGEPLNWPSIFPMNTILAHRACLVAQRELGDAQAKSFILGLYRAYWVEGEDISDAGVIARVAAQHGVEAEVMAQGVQDPEIKQLLKDNTQRAIDHGVFGAPTFIVGSEMFWGNDRMDFLAKTLSEQ